MPSEQKRHRLLRWLVLSVVALVVVLLLAVGIVVARASAIATYVTERALPGLETKIGRKITIGGVRVRVFPNPHADVSHFTVSGAGDEPPLVEAPLMSGTIELWPLVKTFGRDIRIDNVELVQPTINLVRRANGTWSHSEVIDALQSHSPEPAPTSGEGHPSGGQKSPEISGIDVSDGKVVIIDRSGGKAATKNRPTVALEHIDLKGRNLFQSGTVLRLDAAVGPSKVGRNVHVDLKLTPTARGQVTLTSIAFSEFRSFLPEGVDAIVSQGTVTFKGDVSRSKEGVVGLAGDASAAGLSLRGKPASGKLHFKGSLDPRSNALTASIDGLDVEGPGTRLGGTAWFGTAPPHGEFDLQGDRLDLDAILGGAPSGRAPSGASPPPETAQGTEGTDLMPSDVRDRIASVKVAGHLRLGAVTRGALELSNLDARGELDHGIFRLIEGTAKLYGGTLTLSGSSVDLGQARPVWNLQSKLDAIDLGQGTQQVAKVRPLDGALGGALELHGAGADWPNIRNTVTGQGSLDVRNATLATNLSARFADSLVHVVEALELQPGALPKIDKTQLGDLHASVAVQDGWMRLTSPLNVQTPFGVVHVGGRVSLDRNLDLTGTVDLDPRWVQTLSAGKIVPHNAVAVPIVVKGTANEPQFQVTMAAIDVAKQLVGPGALPSGLQNLVPGIGGGPKPNAPTVPHLPTLPHLPKIPGVTAPPNADGGTSPGAPPHESPAEKSE